MSHAVPWCLRKLFSPPSLHPSLDFAPLSRRQWRFVFLHATDFSFGRNKCIKQRDYQIRHCLIVLTLCQSKEYAAISFNRRGLLSPVSLQYQQTDFNLLDRANVCGPGYSLPFGWKISRHKMMYLPPQAPANTHFALVFLSQRANIPLMPHTPFRCRANWNRWLIYK